MQTWTYDPTLGVIPNVRILEVWEVVDELRKEALRRVEEWQRKKEEERRRIRVKVVRTQIRSVNGTDGIARRIVRELLESWASICKAEGTLVRHFEHHTPLRNSYIHATITATIADERNGQFEMRVIHFRHFTAHAVFTASLETAAP